MGSFAIGCANFGKEPLLAPARCWHQEVLVLKGGEVSSGCGAFAETVIRWGSGPLQLTL